MDLWLNLFITTSEILLIVFMPPLSYLMLLAISATRPASKLETSRCAQSTRFMIIIPAHNEGSVIRETVERLNSFDYPPELVSIYVIADHCSDDTAETARRAGAIVYERNEGPRTGKGVALTWLFEKVLDKDQCDAVVIFDADTRVDPAFLRVMDCRLAQGDQVIQGQHIIGNPDQGWFPMM